MSQHVLARVSGFGWTVLPYAPFQCECPGSAQIVVMHDSRQARIDVASGKPILELAPGTEAVHEVADLLRGPEGDHWRIETSVFTIRWPTGFALWSSAQAPGFDLLGPDQTMIYLQGPILAARLPALADMHAPEQAAVAIGENWIELGYEHEGRAWRQRHIVAALDEYRLVVTGQGPEEHFDAVSSAVQEVAESVLRYSEG